jgi:glycosyltransferase involved in cell wall biosynthesis
MPSNDIDAEAVTACPIALYFHRLAEAGGAERMITALANDLSARGFEVHLVSWDPPEARPYFTPAPGVTWHGLGITPGLRDKARRTLALSDILKRTGCRVLVGFVMSSDKTVYAAAKLAGVRIIAAERNAPSLYRHRHSTLSRCTSFTLLHLADAITVQFAEYADGYPRTLRKRISAIPNPVPLQQRQAHPASVNAAGRYTLLCVTRLDPVQKRVGCLLRAFSRVAKKHAFWDVTIVGDGPERAELQAIVLALGLEHRVTFVASMPNLAETYSSANLFVIPSLWEGFPNALAEAMSHGLPAVGFGGAEGVSNLIQDGTSGWLARGVDDDAALAVALDEAMSNDLEREDRGRLAADSMKAYAPAVQFDRWVDLIQSVLRES